MPFPDIRFARACNYDSSFVSGGIDEVMKAARSCPCGRLFTCHITAGFKILDKKASKDEHYSRRNRKPLRGWPPTGIRPVAQTQERQVAVTKVSRPLLSGLFAFATGSK